MKILIAGELNPDLVLRNYQKFPELGKEVLVEDLDLTLGSSSAICAVGLAKLGDAVTFAATVGTDAYGDYCTAALERAGIDVSLVQHRSDLKTGITVSITSSSDRALVTYPGAIGCLSAADLPNTAFAGFRHFHVSSYFLQDALRPGLRNLFAMARKAGLTTSLDPGYDPSEKWSADLIDVLQEVDVFLPNEVEIRGITGLQDVRAGLANLDNSHTLVVGKLGAEGCMTRYQGEWIRVPAFPIDAVDPTGAGDSFNAGFLHKWLRGEALRDCLVFASACGALSTRGLGGTATQATEAEAAACLQAQGGEFVARA
ncbi:MAG: sugar kinase [Bryobacteraceae bacterium]